MELCESHEIVRIVCVNHLIQLNGVIFDIRPVLFELVLSRRDSTTFNLSQPATKTTTSDFYTLRRNDIDAERDYAARLPNRGVEAFSRAIPEIFEQT